MIDSHAHLDFSQYDSDRDEVIREDFESGIEAVVNIGVDLETSRKSIALAERYEGIYATVGIHPHDSGNAPRDYLKQLEALASHKKAVAIGEIGLDYYRDHSPRDTQRRAFEQQLELARKLDMPVVVHIREAVGDSFKILEKSGVGKGVLHSFPGDESEARKAIEMGFFISFAGPITYPRSTRVKVAASLPLSRIVAETDAPYLTPQAFRGKRNRPQYVRYVIEKLGAIFEPYTFDDIERITSHNARRLFGLPFEKIPGIVYKIRRSLYVNLTNRCSCDCYFCPRSGSRDGFVSGHYLFLRRDPSVEEILEAVEIESGFDEVVFCGLGEPTMRLKEMLDIAAKLKSKGYSMRLNTNGHGGLINKIDLPPRLAGLIDRVSVSLNAQDADTYLRICRPDRGMESFEAMIGFVKGCRKAGIETIVSVVDLPEIDIEACRKLASDLGVGLRIRSYSGDRRRSFA
ncbi:MAG: YchF/TatD family DNA exonuclease [Candidatus Zixiibacteriota bacterium]|nr:MAG: YchF/TatD family DNA exonuclease [candidate division Zixibacteria bacterium]